jgi:hypothetical protein
VARGVEVNRRKVYLELSQSLLNLSWIRQCFGSGNCILVFPRNGLRE